MQEKPTNELDELLGEMKPEALSGYYRDNGRYLADDKKAFYYYFKDRIEEKRILLKDVYSFAGVTESWGGKIITQERHTKSRDLILRLCIAARFSLQEINRGLKLYGMTPLYAKDRRDAAIIVAINNRIYDLGKIDDLLTRQNLPLLSAEEG